MVLRYSTRLSRRSVTLPGSGSAGSMPKTPYLIHFASSPRSSLEGWSGSFHGFRHAENGSDPVTLTTVTRGEGAYSLAYLCSLSRYSGGSERIQRLPASGRGWGLLCQKCTRRPPPQPSPGVPGEGDGRVPDL